MHSHSVTSRLSFRFPVLLKKKKKKSKAQSGTRWLELVTIYFKKPVNWKVPKQYPSVFIFLRQGVGTAWTPHKHTRVLVCVLTPLKRKEQTLTPFSGAHAEEMRSWPLNAVTLIPSTVYTDSFSTETTPPAGVKGFWAPTLKRNQLTGTY